MAESQAHILHLWPDGRWMDSDHTAGSLTLNDYIGFLNIHRMTYMYSDQMAGSHTQILHLWPGGRWMVSDHMAGSETPYKISDHMTDIYCPIYRICDQMTDRFGVTIWQALWLLVTIRHYEIFTKRQKSFVTRWQMYAEWPYARFSVQWPYDRLMFFLYIAFVTRWQIDDDWPYDRLPDSI